MLFWPLGNILEAHEKTESGMSLQYRNLMQQCRFLSLQYKSLALKFKLN